MHHSLQNLHSTLLQLTLAVCLALHSTTIGEDENELLGLQPRYGTLDILMREKQYEFF